MVIKKNTHAPLRFPKLLIGEVLISAIVEFTDSCRYDVGEDQLDVNKLFGIGYFPTHHTNSVRFGWRYDKNVDKIEILAYYYLNGDRHFDTLTWADIGVSYRCVIFIEPNNHTLCMGKKDTGSLFEVEYSVPVKRKSVGYLLRPYFGGNKKAPHNIEIKIEL